MSTVLNSTCDRARAYATPCGETISDGRFVLVTTILASSLAYVDGSVVNVGLVAIGRSFDGGCVRIAVGDQRLSASIECAAVAGRRSRRSLWPPAHPGIRYFGLRGGVDHLRAGARSSASSSGDGCCRVSVLRCLPPTAWRFSDRVFRARPKGERWASGRRRARSPEPSAPSLAVGSSISAAGDRFS